LQEKPEEFDPRKYLQPARDELIKMYKEKILMFLEVLIEFNFFKNS